MPAHVSFPDETEYAPYYKRYIGLLPDADILQLLDDQLREALSLLDALTEEQAVYAYAEGKWSIKEVIGHIIDTERIFSYRGLCFARGDETPLPGMEQDDYVIGGRFDQRSVESLRGEYEHLRLANLALFHSWDDEMQARIGIASGFRVSARAIPFILAGHERHHLNILHERYGLGG